MKLVAKPKKKSEPITMGLSRELGKIYKMKTKPHGKRRDAILANLRRLGFRGDVFYKYSKIYHLTKVAMGFIEKKARSEGFVGKVFRKNKLTYNAFDDFLADKLKYIKATKYDKLEVTYTEKVYPVHEGRSFLKKGDRVL